MEISLKLRRQLCDIVSRMSQVCLPALRTTTFSACLARVLAACLSVISPALAAPRDARSSLVPGLSPGAVAAPVLVCWWRRFSDRKALSGNSGVSSSDSRASRWSQAASVGLRPGARHRIGAPSTPASNAFIRSSALHPACSGSCRSAKCAWRAAIEAVVLAFALTNGSRGPGRATPTRSARARHRYSSAVTALHRVRRSGSRCSPP